MRAAILSVLAISLFTFACGGNEPPPANPAPAIPSAPPPADEKAAHHGEHGEHEKGGEQHGAMPQGLHDFHEVLAPMWHANAGVERIGKTCSGQADLKAKATAVADAELGTDVDAVAAACAKPDHANVETKLGVVHERFHKLMEAQH